MLYEQCVFFVFEQFCYIFCIWILLYLVFGCLFDYHIVEISFYSLHLVFICHFRLSMDGKNHKRPRVAKKTYAIKHQ